MKKEYRKRSGLILGLFLFFLTLHFAMGQASGDSDGDTIADTADLDDDNDGIADATESPDCFYIASDFEAGGRSSFVTVSTGLNMNASYNAPQELVDGDAGTTTSSYAVNFNSTPTQSNVGKNIYTIQFEAPVELTNIYLQYIDGNSHFANGAVVKLRGSYDGSTWIDLNTGATYNQANTNGIVLNQGTMRYQVFSVTQNSDQYLYYQIRGVSGTISSAGTSNEVYFQVQSAGFSSSLYPKGTCTADTDGDSILNHQDLDSDGDGCSDSYEAGAIASETANHQFNTSSGGDANGDGLADVVDDGSNGGTASDGMPDYTYTPYAYSSTLNFCNDADNDGESDITDIDDDNDGITDAIESPDCYYSASDLEAGDRSSFVTVTTGLNMTTTYHEPQKLVDGDASSRAVQFVNSQSNVGSNVFTFQFEKPVELSNIYLQYYSGNRHFLNTSVVKLQGSDDGDNWIDLNAGVAYNQTGTIGTVMNQGLIYYQVFSVTQNSDQYHYYRIKGVSHSTSIWSVGASNEVYFEVHSGYHASLNPRGGSCTTDTDADGILNHHDLDSDGDGCSDSYEAGAITSETANHQFNTSSGGDANGDGLADVVDDGSNGGTASDGMPDYTYTPYAYLSAFNLCTDTDDDGKNDIADIDDDNDGIIDARESPDCFYTEAEATQITNISTEFPPYDNRVISYAADGDPSTYSAFVADVGAVGNVLFHITPQAPIQLEKMEYDPRSWGITNSTDRAKLQGYNGEIWEDLTGGLELTATSGTVSIENTLHPNTVYSAFRLIISAASNFYAGINEIRLVAHNYNASLNPKASCTTDQDGDGIVNHRDLDCDGDGCSDSYEAGAITSETANHQFNTSGSGDANGDGLADVVDDGSNGGTASDGIPDYIYTPYAYSSTLNLCKDTDDDGKNDLTDIDDDNDGITDATESPGCFYTEAEATKITSISTDISPYSNHYITYAIDGDPSTYSAFANDAGAVGNVLFHITPQAPIQLAKIEYDPISWGITNSTDRAKLQGYNGAIWEDLTGDLVLTATSGTVSIENTLHPNTVYREFRLIISAASNYYAGIKEIRLVALKYNSSLHPKAACTTDTDSDDIFNHQDLDTDGDGCTDAEEAGTYNKAGVVMEAGEVKNGSGGFVSSVESNPNAVVGGPYGGNGFADVLQKASPDTNQYKYTYTYGNATDSTVHNCCPVIGNNTIGSDQRVCPPDTASTLTGSVPTLRPMGATVLYQWMSSTSGATSGFSNVPGRTSKDFVFSGPLAQTTHYKRVAYTAACPKYNDTTAAVTVTVKPLPTITDVQAPICYDTDRYITAFETSWQDSSTVSALPEGIFDTTRASREPGGDESWYLEVPNGTDFTVTVTEDGCSVEKTYTAPPDSCEGGGPYALGLEDFSAERVEGGIRLSWRVAEPELLDRAVLERGGVPTGLESIGVFLDPEGDGYYNYVDRDPVVGENFYRLSLYGADGTVEASEGLRVVYDPLDKYAYLLQNPVEGGMVVLRTNTDAPVVSVYDLSGRAVPFSSDRQIGGDLHLFFGGISDRVLIVRLRAGQLLRSFRVVLR